MKRTLLFLVLAVFSLPVPASAQDSADEPCTPAMQESIGMQWLCWREAEPSGCKLLTLANGIDVNGARVVWSGECAAGYAIGPGTVTVTWTKSGADRGPWSKRWIGKGAFAEGRPVGEWSVEEVLRYFDREETGRAVFDEDGRLREVSTWIVDDGSPGAFVLRSYSADGQRHGRWLYWTPPTASIPQIMESFYEHGERVQRTIWFWSDIFYERLRIERWPNGGTSTCWFRPDGSIDPVDQQEQCSQWLEEGPPALPPGVTVPPTNHPGRDQLGPAEA